MSDPFLISLSPSPLIAFLGSCCKTTNHHCGNCHRKVGTRKRDMNTLFVFRCLILEFCSCHQKRLAARVPASLVDLVRLEKCIVVMKCERIKHKKRARYCATTKRKKILVDLVVSSALLSIHSYEVTRRLETPQKSLRKKGRPQSLCMITPPWMVRSISTWWLAAKSNHSFLFRRCSSAVSLLQS